MNPKTLWETTLDPKTRSLLKVQVANEKKTEKVLDELLGKDPASRFKLIQDNATRIDIEV